MRRKETRVDRADPDDEDRDRPPSLRIAGYVPGEAEREADESGPATGIRLPNISDYWPDAPHRRRAPGDQAEQSPGWQVLLPTADGRPTVRRDTDSRLPVQRRPVGETPDRRWQRRPIILTGLLALVVAGGTVLLVRPAGDPGNRENAAVPLTPVAPSSAAPIGTVSVAPPAPSSAAPTETTPSPSPETTKPATSAPPPEPLPDRVHFILADGVTELSVRTADLGDEPFQVSTPAGSGLDVDTTFADGVLRIANESTGDGSGKLEVRLNKEIVWHLQLNEGVRLGEFVMGTGTVSRIDLDGGGQTYDISLGRLSRTLPIRMTGGVRTWRIKTAEQVPVEVNVGNGAGDVTLYGDSNGGTGSGETVRSGDLDDEPGLDIDAAAGVGSLEVSES
jgi:septal ring-binding cell division protein DamX